MDLLKLNLFRGSIFKQAKFLFSSPQQALKMMLVSEAATLSQEVLSIHTGFVKALEQKRAWVVLHNLKFRIYKNGVPTQDEPVLLISERSYIPLDPNRIIKPEDREKLTSLKNIASQRHAVQLADAGKGEYNTTIQELVIQSMIVLMGILVVATLIMKSCGGP